MGTGPEAGEVHFPQLEIASEKLEDRAEVRILSAATLTVPVRSLQTPES